MSRRQTRRRLGQLMAQFPLCGFIASYTRSNYKLGSEMGIHVQKGDPEFFHYQARNIYVSDRGHYVMHEKGYRGTREEYLLADSFAKDLIAEITWDPAFPGNDQLYAKDIFKKVDPLHVHYLVWVTHYVWYTPPTAEEEDQDVTFGEPVKSELQFIVYVKPKNKSWIELVDEADRLKKEREEAYLYPPKLMPGLPGIEQALREGCRLHAFLSGGGLRVISIGKKNEPRGYGESPHVEDALNHADEDFLAGGREYSSVYGSNGIYPHYLTGSTLPTSNLDAWLRRGSTFDVWQEGEGVVFQLDGTTSERFAAPEWAMQWTMMNPKVPVYWYTRGFVFELTYKPSWFNGELVHSKRVFSAHPDRDEVDAIHWKITKTGRGRDFWDAMLGAFDAPEVEVLKPKRKRK